MGEVRDMWHWTPLTDSQKAHLDALAPDRKLGRAAAIEYLDRKKEVNVIDITPPILLPVAILLILAGLLGITAGFMR